MEIIQNVTWSYNPIIFVQEKDKNKFMLLGTFYILESPEVPLTPLDLRNHFDYTVEKSLKNNFEKVLPVFGPHWQYIIPSRDFEKNIRIGNIFISSPLVGNSINI